MPFEAFSIKTPTFQFLFSIHPLPTAPVEAPGKATGFFGERRSKDTGGILCLQKMQRCGFRFDDVGAEDHFGPFPNSSTAPPKIACHPE